MSTSLACTEGWSVFPREREGNLYPVNWSLNEDGVVAVGDAFQNARLPVLTTRLEAKVENGKVNVAKPAFSGEYSVVEAGDGIGHQEFSNVLSSQQAHLSSGVELFVEDAAVGASRAGRLGVRVVSDSPATALIARSLMIKVPTGVIDHRARFDGWNLDERWIGTPEGHFDAITDEYIEVNAANQKSKGQRPIVAFVGGAGAQCAVQFVERDSAIVGANVSVGSEAPVRAMIDAIGHAANVVMTEQVADGFAVSSTSIINKKGETVLVIGADDSVVDAAQKAGSLYGAYNNLVTPAGVSALWSGVVSAVPAEAPSSHRFTVPYVVNGNKTVVAVQPDNMVAPATNVVFYEKGAAKKALSTEEAAAKLMELTDESKAEAIKAVLKGAKCSIAGSAADAIVA
jgi:hypothetical protein